MFIGSVTDVRTEAEISWTTDGSEDVVAVVYETHVGWMTQVYNEALAAQAERDFSDAVEAARETLLSYVNRLGDNQPDGLSPAGLSLWLLEKADGTAMGRPLR